MGTFGAWLNSKTGEDGPAGNFARHVMHRHDDGCRTCRSKEDREELTWGVADVVRDLDEHHAHHEFYDQLDDVVAAWGAERAGRG